MTTTEMSDRLYRVICELTIVADALQSLSLDRRRLNGLSAILDRQVEELYGVKSEIHPGEGKDVALAPMN